MQYISVCSGIEAATAAWGPLGWRPLFYAETDKFPSAVLDHHYPDVPNMGDITKFKEWPDYAANILVGGTPCQSFSVAGLRKGLDDPRGNLMLTYLAIADRYRPEWLVWENVAGVLSSNKGRDFATFLTGLEKLGYGFAYRVLDAQYFGVAQRRRRVFVVGHLGDWRRAAAVLFEQAGLSRDPAPSREKVPVAAGLTANGVGTCGADDNQAQAGHLIVEGDSAASTPKLPRLRAGCGRGGETAILTGSPCLSFTQNQSGDILTGDIAPSMGTNQNATGRNTPKVVTLTPGDRGMSVDQACGNMAIAVRTAQTSSNGHGVSENITYTLDGANGQAICFTQNDGGRDCSENIANTLRSGGDGRVPYSAVCFAQKTRKVFLRQDTHVRRLTPRECERLQGFPDDFTLIPWRGKPAEDCPAGPRYKALGNSMAVPVGPMDR